MNRVILKAQEMTLDEFRQIKKSHEGKKYKKIFFQCELRKFIDGDAIFGLVAYGGYKKSGKACGPPFYLRDKKDGNDLIWETWPLSFGNLEFEIEPDTKKQGKVLKEIFDLLKSKKPDYKKIELGFKPGVSKNPHAYYDITLGANSESVNPCPPTPPSDY